jgi:hypothetical protein
MAYCILKETLIKRFDLYFMASKPKLSDRPLLAAKNLEIF